MFFEPMLSGDKTFEIRRNDRNFQVGDCLRLIEWDPATAKPTGRGLLCAVTYLTDFAQVPGYIVMGIQVLQIPFEEWRI